MCAMDSSIVISGGQVIDGSGMERYAADVVVQGGLVSDICSPGHGKASRIIEAAGMVLCPGFIDSHSHDDQLVLEHMYPHPKISQGVCTVVTGNCGLSLAPLVTSHPPAPLDILGKKGFRFETFAAYLSAIDIARPSVNVVPLVGHTSLRVKHMADLDQEACTEEVRAMHDEVTRALDAGAFGLSTGVYYPPARAATTKELLGVCQSLKGRASILAMHLRDEGDDIDAALREALQVSAASEAHLVLSHHKVVGLQNHGRTVETLGMIEDAALRQSVCLDCYPYAASSTMLSPGKAAAIGEVLISWSAPHPELGGARLKDIAARWSVGLEEAATRLMPGGAIYFGMAPQDVDRVLTHPLTMIGSDGLPHDGRPHPRLWGSFPRVLGHYSRDKGLMTLEMAVHKMTGLPAKRFGLKRRGILAVGHAADLVVFDPLRIRDAATYESPQAPATGIELVLVNGQVAFHRGVYRAQHAGIRLVPGKS